MTLEDWHDFMIRHKKIAKEIWTFSDADFLFSLEFHGMIVHTIDLQMYIYDIANLSNLYFVNDINIRG